MISISIPKNSGVYTILPIALAALKQEKRNDLVKSLKTSIRNAVSYSEALFYLRKHIQITFLD